MERQETAPSQDELIKEALAKNIDIYKLLACDVSDATYFSYSDIKYRALPKSIEELGGDKNTWWLYLLLGRSAKKKSIKTPFCNI